jgi:O-antigen/teichoic acid export membrane protein
VTRTTGRLARNVAWLGVGEVVLKGALFGAGVLVARGLGPAAMGAFTVAYGAAMMLMLVFTAGQAEVLIRETARRPEAVRALGRMSRAWQRRVALAAVPAAIAGSALVPDPGLRWTLLAFIPYAWLRSGLVSVGASFKGLDRMEVEVGARTVELGVALLLLGALAALVAPVWTTGFAFAAGAAGGLAVIRRQFAVLPSQGPAGVTPAFLAREGAAFLALNLGAQAILRLDTFVLAGFGIAKEEIGWYGVAAAPVWGLLGVAQLFAVAAYPTFARLAAEGRIHLRHVAAVTVAGAVAGALVAGLLTAVKMPLVRLVFGPHYLASVPLLGILVWVLPAAYVTMGLGVLIASCGRQRWSLVSQAVLLCGSAVANLAVIPRWGTMGCAVVAVGVWTAGLAASLTVATLAVGHPKRFEAIAVIGQEVE